MEWREDIYTAQFSDTLWDFEGSWDLLFNTDVSFLFWREVTTATKSLPQELVCLHVQANNYILKILPSSSFGFAAQNLSLLYEHPTTKAENNILLFPHHKMQNNTLM